MHTRTWTVEIDISEMEEERRTKAIARLLTDSRTPPLGEGEARRRPRDREVPEIGDELAVGAATPSAEAELGDQVGQWTEKYPDVPVSVSVRRVLDPAVTLVAACRSARMLVVDPSGGPTAAAVVRAVCRRAVCPVQLVE